jgi:hypothetical protein
MRYSRLTLTLRGEFDPANTQWHSLRLNTNWRHNQRTQLRLSYSARLASVFPLRSASDSLLYGGRTHDFSFRLSQRWSRSLSAALRLRSAYGERPYRSEELQLRWGQRRSLSLRLRDSWSPWRQYEQLGLLLQSSLGRHWSCSGGVDATLFRWENTRDAKWRQRIRPQLYLRYIPQGNLSWQLRIKETFDEFQHLRTHAELSTSYAL